MFPWKWIRPQVRSWMLVLLALPAGAVEASAAAQQAEAQQPPVIREIVIVGGGEREQDIRRALSFEVGQPFRWDTYRRDAEFLWKRMRVRMEEAVAIPLEDGSIRLRLRVVPLEALRRLVFLGAEEFERERLLLAAQMTEGQWIDPEAVPRILGNLEQFYKREGYYWVDFETEIEQDKDQLTIHIYEGPLVRVGDITFRGNEEFPGGTFLGLGLDLAGEIESGDGWFIFPGSKFSEETLQLDLTALGKLYHDYGYLEATASLESMEFYRDDKSRVELVFYVHEGPRYTVRDIQLESAEDGAELRYPKDELMEVIGLEPGMPYLKARILADEAALRKYYGRRGHPSSRNTQARVRSFFEFNPPRGEPQTVFDTQTHEVDVTYVILEGRPMRIRDIIIQGNTHTQDSVIRRNISLEPGDLADSEEAVRSWRRLIGLNYFQDPETRQPFVDWRFMETDREDWVDLRYEVSEGQTGRMLFGGGYNTAFGPFVQVMIQKDNFNLFDPPSSLGNAWSETLSGRAFTGAGQTVRLVLAPGTEYSNYSLSFFEPDLFNNHIDRWSLNTRLFKSFLFLQTHDEERTGGSFTIGRNFGRFFNLFVSPGIQEVAVDDIRSGAPTLLREVRGDNQLNELTFGFRYNTVEDPFSPVDGGSIGMSYSQAGEWVGGNWDFSRVEMNFAKYFKLWEDSLDRPFVLAASGALRHAWETGDLSGVPYTERYFLGGQSTLRGFDFRGVGPRANGFPLGGEDAWNGTLEFRFPLVSTRQRNSVQELEYIRGAVFMDFGSVGDELSALGPTRISGGVGVRIRLPFMVGLALQLDFGWPLQNEPRDDARVFSFQFGSL
ncbi:MAG: hypothetical protein DWQ01_21815 [Planctomycetota bacterium]|nr:MAG: hypothetical protein DWQ01_21815 [Planctomycetota bacterium]